MRRITASVRSSVAASGKLRETHEILLVLRRHEAGRRVREPEVREPEQSPVYKECDAAGANDAADAAHVARREGCEEAVERAEEPAEQPIENAGQAIRRAPCSLSSSAESAGESVRELNAEITVLIAMVSANCL